MYYWWYPDGYSSPWRNSRAETPRTEATGSGDGLVRLAEELLADPRIRGQISLDLQNGVVILDGQVGTERARDRATALAWSAPGVTDVCNALTVSHRRWPFRRAG
ncbi:BON domain-containing protein [Paractinoplanes atraurantiacus]|uniref:BON domain-containing protein n=1 Tax=Paractinoplanes atraurantiacus TaxID=1036182 RepID=A0A285GQ97_9ACTN|nr:BON domain-containing protein [Actinoplanes atraurantiacus]SNY25618.1 BON domain-containing protein [Actinoplanes atraurantiacus]